DTTSGQEGIALLQQLHGLDPSLPVIVMTAWGTIDLAVAALRAGARDFITKPWENPRLLTIVRNQIDYGRSLRTQHRLKEETRVLRGGNTPALIAQSAVMQPVLEIISRVGPTDANVLI